MPTETQVKTAFADTFRVLNNFLKYLRTNSPKFTGTGTSDEGTLRGNLLSDFTYHDAWNSELEDWRRGYGNQILRASSLLTPPLREYGRVIQVPELDPQTIIDRLYDDYVANTKRVKSRGFVLGTPAASGSPVGNGIINRLKLDEEAFTLDAQTPDVKTAECLNDQDSGAFQHEERFEIRGQDPGRDTIVIKGSGLTTLAKALSARDSLLYIANPSFSERSGTDASPTDLSGWGVVGGALGTNIQFDTATIYRGFEGDVTPKSIKFLTGGAPTLVSIDQQFSFRRVQVNRRVPMYFQLAVYRNAGATGDIQFLVGSQTVTVSLASLTNNAWSIIRMATGTTPGGNQKNWYRQFNDPTLLNRIVITWTNNAAGQSILIDDVIFSPFSPFDGDWYAIVGGTIPWRIRDKYTWTDTNNDDTASEGIIQKWFWRRFGRYLPHDPGSTQITWADPT